MAHRGRNRQVRCHFVDLDTLASGADHVLTSLGQAHSVINFTLSL